MKPRRQRMLGVGLAALGVLAAVGLTLNAFQENMMFYVEISDVVAGNVPDQRSFRVGGLVVPDSVVRESGELEVKFAVTDTRNSLDIYYSGVLPDLFREGQGIIAHGSLKENGDFEADTVLAKHDENYMPPEVADSLAKYETDNAAATVVEE
jgi:cytochrome c-type biogenesis protein CcmE